MAADLDDVLVRLTRVEDAITGPDGLRVTIARADERLEAHLLADARYQDEAREEWKAAREDRVRFAAMLAEVKAAAEKPRGPSVATIAAMGTALTGVLGAVATIVAALMGADPPKLPTANADAAVPPLAAPGPLNDAPKE